MKNKFLPIIGVVIVLVAGFVGYRFLNAPEQYLFDFTVKTTFPQSDLDTFQKTLQELQAKIEKNIDDYREEAKMNDYLGFPGRGILIYESNLATSKDFIYYNNLGNLYLQVCAVKKDITCDRALAHFRETVNTYGTLQNYKSIVQTLVYMGDKIQAAQEYETYITKGGKPDEYLESIIK